MLTTKRINLGIAFLSKVLRFFLIFYTAFILAKCVWWVLSPADNNIFIEWADLDKQDKATNYINNRYPFGIITVVKPKEPPKPKVIDQLKLTGIYLNTEKDSFAFVEYQGKPAVVRVGDSIEGSSATVKEINSDSIVVSEDDRQATVTLSAGTEQSNTPAAGNNPQSPQYNNSMFSRSNNQPNMNSQPGNASQQPVNSQNSDDSRPNRRRMVEDFVRANPLDRTESPGNNRE